MTATPAPAACGCPDYLRASRRGLLRTAAGVGAGLATTAAFGTAFVETSYAATRSAERVLVVLSLRGAVDGMSLVVPHGDPVYYAARPDIAIPAERLLARDGFFGLHPGLEPLLPLWRSGRMAAVHATGLPVPNRSHFSAMEEVEDAAPGSTARTGWLNRLIGRDGYASPLRAIQVGASTPPTSLRGPQRSVSFESIADLRLAGADQWDSQGRRPRSLRTLWNGVPGPLAAGARAGMQAVGDFAPVRATAEAPANGAAYPEGDFGRAMAAVARTLRGDVGAEVITVDCGSWDHHVNLGPLAWGRMQEMTAELGRVLAAFFADLGPLADRVTVVTLSEFGRRTRQNANHGLDHGWGNVMLLLGAGVRGGYRGRWPGLTDGADADLSVTTDYRSVLSEVVTRRLGASSAAVFPGFRPESVGVIA